MFILWALLLRSFFLKLWRDLLLFLFLPLVLLLLPAWRCQICRKVETLLLSSSRTSITVPSGKKPCADRTLYETNAISFFFFLFSFFFFFFFKESRPWRIGLNAIDSECSGKKIAWEIRKRAMKTIRLSHMTSGIQWQAMQAHKKVYYRVVNCPPRTKRNFDCSNSPHLCCIMAEAPPCPLEENKRGFPSVFFSFFFFFFFCFCHTTIQC